MAAHQLFRNGILWLVTGGMLAGCNGAPVREPFRLSNAMQKQPALATQPQFAASRPPAQSPAGGNHTNLASVAQPVTDFITSEGATPEAQGMPMATPAPQQPALASVVNSVRDAFTLEPQVIPAKDPTDLSSNPGPLRPHLFLSAATLFEKQGELEKAQDQYERAIAAEPTNRAALIGLARLQHRRGAMEQAINTYRQALTVHAQDPVILNDLGLCLARQGDQEEAIHTLNQVVQLRPDSALYRNNLAAVLVEARRPADAVAALSTFYGPAIAHYNVGYMLNQHGDAQSASEYFARALQLDPSMQQARAMLQRVAPQLGVLPPDHRPPTMPLPSEPTGSGKNETANHQPLPADAAQNTAVSAAVEQAVLDIVATAGQPDTTPTEVTAPALQPAGEARAASQPSGAVAQVAHHAPLEADSSVKKQIDDALPEPEIRWPTVPPETSSRPAMVAPMPLDFNLTRQARILPIPRDR